jgi:two-component system phosphate regulon sensor histidine kinase PhoR
MNPTRPWWVAELLLLAAALGVGLLPWLAGAGGAAVVATVLGVLLAWHLLQATRYAAWLRDEVDASRELPGAWSLLVRDHEQALRRARRKWRREHRYQKRLGAAIAALPDAIVILDPQQRVEWCSPQAAGLLGIAWPECDGRPLRELVATPELETLLENDATGEPLRVVSPLDPAVVLSLRMVELPKRKRPRRVLLARDVTTLHNLDRVRQDFIANVSHELRTPLTVLRGFLESMESDPAVAEEWAAAIDTMLAQARRMQSLTEDLLTLSRLELGTPDADDEPVDVGELLDELTGEARSLSGEAGHVITLDVDRTLQLVGLSRELRSAFANLVFNAVLHTPPRCRIRIGWAADGDGARFTVHDTGDGIAPEHLPRLTERFYRVDPSRSRASGGTGLGLAIVKHVLLHHDSSLEVTSKRGIGSTFSCRFPATRVVRVRAEETA